MSIQSQIERLTGVKTAIKDAIVKSGVAIPDNTPFTEYANKANQIVGQFDSKLDEIIGGEIVPVLDIEKRLESVNGITGDINTQLNTLDGTKAALAGAIVEKGVEIPEGTPFGEYAGKISKISTGLSDSDMATVQISAFFNPTRLIYTNDKMEVVNIADFNSAISVKIPKKTLLYMYSWMKYPVTPSGDVENPEGSIFLIKGDGSVTQIS